MSFEDRPRRRLAANPEAPVMAGPRDADAPGPKTGARRPADRHYLAVVSAEARRLARQLRPDLPDRPPAGQVHAEGSH
jgi:hypothetical protein